MVDRERAGAGRGAEVPVSILDEQEQHEARAAPCVEELASLEGEAPRVPYSPASRSLPSISSKSKSRARPASPLQPGVEEVTAPAVPAASRRRARPPRPLQPCVEQARSDAPASEQEMEQGKATVRARDEGGGRGGGSPPPPWEGAGGGREMGRRAAPRGREGCGRTPGGGGKKYRREREGEGRMKKNRWRTHHRRVIL